MATIFGRFGAILAPFWGPGWEQKGAKMDQKTEKSKSQDDIQKMIAKKRPQKSKNAPQSQKGEFQKSASRPEDLSGGGGTPL